MSLGVLQEYPGPNRVKNKTKNALGLIISPKTVHCQRETLLFFVDVATLLVDVATLLFVNVANAERNVKSEPRI